MPESTLTTKLDGSEQIGNCRHKRSRSSVWLRSMSSLRITGIGLLLLGAGGVVASGQNQNSQWLIIASLLLLAINLCAALLSNPLFRLKPALFGMHVGLLLLAVSLAYGHLSRFRGHFEITEGQGFDPQQVIVDRQSLLAHELPLEDAFRQGEVRINYAPGMMRRDTNSQLLLADGQMSIATDGQPAVIDNNRFYVTHNKGFSALISWWPAGGGPPSLGTLHFPSYPRLAPMQHLFWTAPDGTELSIELAPKHIPHDENWALNRSMSEMLLLVTREGNKTRLGPGESIRLAGGVCRFEGIRMWIGYRIFHDPSLYWCFASAMMVVCCLAWHLAGRYLRKSKCNKILTDAGRAKL
ncbi:MAG: hypothetical protein JAY60_18810 [Candidatus Thiodiazotropha weberae]|nr:hypothetical protein [Candidatus Thiodiazotropha weberae]MCG7931521.1 hypothetical protein [Candidatus Thiodiazotropha lotti]MCW4221368.1 hypothetical protein [Candidatus Thiodiazotropha lotti]